MMVSLDDLCDAASQYHVQYRVLNGKSGLINHRDKLIYISPLEPQHSLVLVHELLHHYYDFEQQIEMPEYQIENIAQDIYQEHFLLCEKLLAGCLKKKRRYEPIAGYD